MGGDKSIWDGGWQRTAGIKQMAKRQTGARRRRLAAYMARLIMARSWHNSRHEAKAFLLPSYNGTTSAMSCSDKQANISRTLRSKIGCRQSGAMSANGTRTNARS